jgi:hypothetical protein
MRNFLPCACFLAFTCAQACTHVTVRRDAPPPLTAGRARAAAAKAIEAAPPSDDDVFLAMPRLLGSINAARQARGAPELRIDRGLALVAQEAGAEYQRLGRGFEERVAARANAELRSFSLVFERVVAMVVFVERLEQAQVVVAPAMDPEMRFVGMSVGRSPTPTSLQGGYAVVITLGQ